ncbi:hypothetical protein ACHAW5_002792 [Stephanodiscus triporus]|uniref:DEK-C domain-containing protein n=1 Tax=Stephanodiscus triporus TaxID=2934178 RepID=A0ABD3QKT5_9STRA
MRTEVEEEEMIPESTSSEAVGEKPVAAEPEKEEDAEAEADEEKEEDAEAEAEEEEEDAEAEAEEEEEDAEAEAEEEEEEEGEQEVAPTIDAKNTAKEPTASPTGRGRRERKSIETFVPGESAKEKEAYPDGKGQKLKDIPNVAANFKSVTWSDPHLRMLHTLAIGGHGKKKELKSNLLEFSGIVYPEGKDEEEERQKMKERMYKLKMPDLKSVMDLADIDRSKISDKEDHCKRLLEWLEKPEACGKNKRKEGAASKKRKSSTGSKGMSAKKSPSTAKKAKKTPEKQTKTSAAKSPSKAKKTSDKIDLNIPGIDVDKLREKVKSVVETSNREELTVKGVRKILEDWLDADLTEHKDAIRSIVMDAM